MKILVTGAAGFIGYHASQRLLHDGHILVGADNLSDYYDVALKQARLEYKLPEMLAHLGKIPLLILDDIGYVKKDQHETSVLFDLIADRYESSSIIITANQPFSDWDNIFPDSMMAVAAIDRIIHHASIINITGESFRSANSSINA